MSAKKNSKNKSGKRVALWVTVTLEVLILAAALLILWALVFQEKQEKPAAENTPSATNAASEATDAADATQPTIVLEEISTQAQLGENLMITDIGAYTGIFMEDGSDEVVTGVLMLVVKNTGENDLQYAQITIPTNDGDAQFSVSTLPVGESCVLLEQNRMQYTGTEDAAKAEASAVAEFTEPLSLCEDQLKFQILDGAINVTNISGEDISGDVVIYYKNAASDLYYGGITYRVRIEGGIKTDEIKQIMATHFSDTGSKIMFVTVG